MNKNPSLRTIAARLVWVMLAAASLSSAGCSFEQRWQTARVQPIAPAPSLIGCWQGTWHDSANSSGGDVRCIISQGKGDRLCAVFMTSQKGWCSSTDQVKLKADWWSGRWHLSGNTGSALLGTMTAYDGFAVEDQMAIYYASTFRSGVLRLQRLEQLTPSTAPVDETSPPIPAEPMTMPATAPVESSTTQKAVVESTVVESPAKEAAPATATMTTEEPPPLPQKNISTEPSLTDERALLTELRSAISGSTPAKGNSACASPNAGAIRCAAVSATTQPAGEPSGD